MKNCVEIYDRPVKRLMNYAVEQGCDRKELESLITITPPEIEGLFPTVPLSSHCLLLKKIAELTENQNIGLYIYRHIEWAELGVLGYAYMNARTVAQALKIRNRYYRMVIQSFTEAKFDLKADGGPTYTYNVLDPALPSSRYDNDLDLSGVVYLVRALSGEEDWHPQEVHFSHVEPADISEYEKTFRCQLYFNAPECKILFSDDINNLRVKGGDERLFSILSIQLRQLFDRVGQSDQIMWQVQKAIAEELCDGVPRLENIAKRLHMSLRTLQRRLGAADQTYSSLVEQTRKRLAIRYVQFTDQPLIEVAFVLGYAELSPFIRAFKRWTGKTPQQFRKEGSSTNKEEE
jgi:AraC-like DNA-binding protein